MLVPVVQILRSVNFQDRGRFIVGIRKVIDGQEPRIVPEGGLEMRPRHRNMAENGHGKTSNVRKRLAYRQG